MNLVNNSAGWVDHHYNHGFSGDAGRLELGFLPSPNQSSSTASSQIAEDLANWNRKRIEKLKSMKLLPTGFAPMPRTKTLELRATEQTSATPESEYTEEQPQQIVQQTSVAGEKKGSLIPTIISYTVATGLVILFLIIVIKQFTKKKDGEK